MLISLKFHLRGIARHTKGAIKTVLGLNHISQADLERSTWAWHQPSPGHPVELCRCPDKHAPPEEHSEDCVWAKMMCRGCIGCGHCSDCGGDGIDPKAPPMPPMPDYDPSGGDPHDSDFP